jgi:hypothetical protein
MPLFWHGFGLQGVTNPAVIKLLHALQLEGVVVVTIF